MRRFLLLAFASAGLIAAGPTPASPTPAAPTPPAPPAALECARGYAALVAAARATPGATQVATRPGTPLQAISIQADGVLTVFTYTDPGHPAHPYMARRRMVQANGRASVDMSTCPWGDKAASDALTAQFARMNEAFVRQVDAAGQPGAAAAPASKKP